jgi:acetyl esterase
MTAVHPQILALIEEQERAGEDAGPPSLATLRAGYLRTAIELGGPVELVAGVEDVVVPRADGGRVPARVYTPTTPAARPGALVWLHGGGWIMGDLEGFDRVARQLANASGAKFISVDYRLAPEHPHPQPREDARAAVEWAAGAGAEQLGTDPALVIVGGDSAGGHLAVLAALGAREQLLAQLHVYPALDPACDSEAYRSHASDPMLSAEEMRACWAAYVGDGSARDAWPLEADLHGMPPAWIAVAEHDPLRDDGLRYAQALRAADVAVEIAVYEDMTHGFLRWGGVLDRTHELIAWLGGAARGLLAA